MSILPRRTFYLSIAMFEARILKSAHRALSALTSRTWCRLQSLHSINTMLSQLFHFLRTRGKNIPTTTKSDTKTTKTSTLTSPSSSSVSEPRFHPNTMKIAPPRQRTLILDLGDVLFHWSTRDLTVLSPFTFHAVVLSPTWSELEHGHLNENEALETIGKELSLSSDTMKEAYSQCRKTLRVDFELVAQLHALKAEMGGLLKVYAMSNIARDDFARLKAVLPKWDLFDAEFTSFKAGVTKPDLGFYRHVIHDIGMRDPTSAVFVDDKVVNVNAARSFGIHGIVSKSSDDLIRKLRNEFWDPIARARQFMKENARNHTSRIENGSEFADTFSQFLIHQELQDTSLITLSPSTASGAEVTAELMRASTEGKTGTTSSASPSAQQQPFPTMSMTPPMRFSRS
jgi:FMN phosphatase YigB (HAD superfamily)